MEKDYKKNLELREGKIERIEKEMDELQIAIGVAEEKAKHFEAELNKNR